MVSIIKRDIVLRKKSTLGIRDCCVFLEGGFCQDYDRLLHRSSRGHLLCSVRERKVPPRMPLYSSFGIVHVVLVPPPCCTVVETSLVAFDPSASFTRSVTLQNT